MDFSALAPLAASLARAGLPTLGTLLGNTLPFPLNLLAKGAASAVMAALGVDPAAPDAPQQAAAAVATADPDKMAKLQSIEATHKNDLDAAQAELDTLTKDVQNSRATQMGYVEAKSPLQWVAPVWTVIIAIGFFSVTGALLWHSVDLTGNQAAILNVLLGVLTAAFAQCGNFWMGSSKGSQEQSRTLQGLAKAPSTVVQGSNSHVGTTKR